MKERRIEKTCQNVQRTVNIFYPSTSFKSYFFLSLVYIIMEWIEVTLSCRGREISFAGSGSIATLFKMGFMQWTESGAVPIRDKKKSFRSQNSIECRPAYTNNFHVYFSLYYFIFPLIFSTFLSRFPLSLPLMASVPLSFYISLSLYHCLLVDTQTKVVIEKDD